MPGTFSVYLFERLCDLLDERRIVVWYDPAGAFAEFVAAFTAAGCVTVSAAESVLKARRAADNVYRRMNESEEPDEARRNLLIYVPRKRGAGEEERRRDPFEVYAFAGASFGAVENESFESLARQAMPERADEITRLFREGRPTIVLLDGLDKSQRYPLLREALGTESPSEVLAVALCDEKRADAVRRTAGCLEEIRRFLEVEVGFEAPKGKSWKDTRARLGAFVLFSEIAFDLGGMPAALNAVPRAGESGKGTILAACERMRNDTGLRDTYVELAERVEKELRLDELTVGMDVMGERDTFPFEERRYLRRLVSAVEAARIADARAILEGRRRSIWRNHPDRSLIWTAAERCVAFMESADKIAPSWSKSAGSLTAMIKAYAAEGGWSELDRRQRLFEQSAAECAEDGELGSLLAACRCRYREIALAVQERFLERIQAEGWPAEGVLKQSQIFDKYMSPLLEQRAKVAYFLVDSLRFEMGRNLAEALARFGEVEVFPASAVLPTLTDSGMAALLPGADGMLRLVKAGDGIVPALGTRLLKRRRIA